MTIFQGGKNCCFVVQTALLKIPNIFGRICAKKKIEKRKTNTNNIRLKSITFHITPLITT